MLASVLGRILRVILLKQRMIKREFLDGRIVVYNADCMDVMREIGDKEIDLVLTDPPYGIKMAKTLGLRDYKEKQIKIKQYETSNWDNNTPNKIVFDEIFRISNQQIIWGGNYFTDKIGIIKNYIFWYKKGQSKDIMFNEGEMAYISKGVTKQVDIWWNGFGMINSREDRFHPTQKPTALMTWCLNNYSKENELIFDGFLGSGTTAISCIRTNRRLIGCELDPIYFEKMCFRIEEELRQPNLF